MSEHELTEEKIGELWDAGEHTYIFFDDLGMHSKKLFSSFARDAYDLGKQASTGDLRTGWTDYELRAAIHEAGRAVGLSIDYIGGDDVVTAREVHAARRILDALGIDHQSELELPTEVGKSIYDAVDSDGNVYPVMTLDKYGVWSGVDQHGVGADLAAEDIVSFGGVLDLDKVRGEQG